jgi:hypothetical protein
MDQCLHAGPKEKETYDKRPSWFSGVINGIINNNHATVHIQGCNVRS